MFARNEITTMAPPTRMHYPWHEMEEYHPNGGMWATVANGLQRQRFIYDSAELMKDRNRFISAMRTAVSEWPRSVSVALTTPGLNQRAWMGHAGCFLATGSPEETTRLGWHQLTEREQQSANAAADLVISEWLKDASTGVEQMELFSA